MNNKTIRTVAIGVLVVLSMLAGFQLSQYLDNRQSDELPIIEGTVLNPPRQLKAFDLIDQRRHEFRLQNLRGKWTLLFIGYTQCPDVCPNAMMVLRQAYMDMKILNMELPQVVFISIDPKRDEPEILGDYVYYFEPDFIGVTGSEKELQAIAKQLSVVFMKAPGASGDVNKDDYLFDHSASILLINPAAQLQAVFRPPQNKLGIVDGVQQLQKFYLKSE